MATFTPVRLFQVLPGTSEVTAYTVPAATSVIVKQILVANPTATAVAVGVSLVPTGQASGVANRIVPDVMIAANGVVVFDLSQVLNAGDMLATKATAAASVVVTCSGVTVA